MINALPGITAYLRTQSRNSIVLNRPSQDYINDIKKGIFRGNIVVYDGNFTELQKRVLLSSSFSKKEFEHIRILPMVGDILIQFNKFDYRNTRSLDPLARLIIENSFISKGSRVLELGAGTGFACSEIFRLIPTSKIHTTSFESPIAPTHPWKSQYVQLLEIIRNQLERKENNLNQEEIDLHRKVSEALDKRVPYGMYDVCCGYVNNYLLDDEGITLMLDLQNMSSYQCLDTSYATPYIEKQFIGPLDDFVLDSNSGINDYQYNLIYENYGPHKYLLESLEYKRDKEVSKIYFDNLISLISPDGIFLSMNSVIESSLCTNFERMREENKIDKDAILVTSYSTQNNFALLINPENKLCNLLKQKMPLTGEKTLDKFRGDGIYYTTKENLEIVLQKSSKLKTWWSSS